MECKQAAAGQCGDCNTCGKCEKGHEGETLYTMLIYSENFAGILNQITAVFTRRQVNIESLNVCASSTPGVHKYTITCYCDEPMAKMLTSIRAVPNFRFSAPHNKGRVSYYIYVNYIFRHI